MKRGVSRVIFFRGGIGGIKVTKRGKVVGRVSPTKYVARVRSPGTKKGQDALGLYFKEKKGAILQGGGNLTGRKKTR